MSIQFEESGDEETVTASWIDWRFPFGKYKNLRIANVIKTGRGRSYVRWLQSTSDGTHPASDVVYTKALEVYENHKNEGRLLKPAKKSVEPAKKRARHVRDVDTETGVYICAELDSD